MALMVAPILAPMAATAAPAEDAGTTSLTRVGAFSQVVPDGVCSVNVVIAGAYGGSAVAGGEAEPDPDGDPGELRGSNGAGAVIAASLAVGAGQTLTGTIGGAGGNGGAAGLPGGGVGGANAHPGGGGGGYSELRLGAALLLLAGGGGGTGGGHEPDFGQGGDAGAAIADAVAFDGGLVYPGSDGRVGQDAGVLDTAAATAPGGGAGGSTIGGAGGTNPRSTTDPADPGFNWNGFAGSALQGGNGGADNSADTGGAGGGGYFGGGGGASTDGQVGGAATGFYIGGGGGGGASYTSDSALISALTLDKNRNAETGDAEAAFVEFDWVMCDYDLAVTKSVVGAPVFEDGATVRYSVVVTNEGPDDMAIGDTVSLADALAVGGTLVSVSGLSASSPAVGEVISGDIEAYNLVEVDETQGERPVGLASGESVTVVYDVVVSGTEQVTNTVDVTDRAVDDENDAASATIAPAAPSLTMTKSADAAKATAVGQKVVYSFLVTNTGNIELRDIAITEGSFSGAGELSAATCPAEPVQPGASTTCSATYTVVAADLTGAALTNSATASGATPLGAAVASPASTVELPTVKPAGALAVTGGTFNGTWTLVGAAVLLAGGLTLFVVRRRMS